MSASAAMARSLLRAAESAVLATMSQELPGYPFGSVTPFVMTHDGYVCVYVSTIAQHTKNMLAESKVCLTVVEQGDGEQQALGRVTVVGDAVPVPADRLGEVQERYLVMFPGAKSYADTHDFSFFWIAPRRIRFIGGFGKIFWVEPADWAATIDWQADERGIVQHMNDDHRDALVRIVAQLDGSPPGECEMLLCDADGFHVLADERVRWLPFGEVCGTAAAVRQAMVRLAKAATA